MLATSEICFSGSGASPTVRLRNLLRSYDELERKVHVTTPEVHGSTEGWVREERHCNPSSLYAVPRAASDVSHRTYVDNPGFPAVSSRAAGVYGPGQPLYRIVPRTIYAAMIGQELRLDGGGKSFRVLIYITDVSDATPKVALFGKTGDCYHVSGYGLVSIRQPAEIMLESLAAP